MCLAPLVMRLVGVVIPRRRCRLSGLSGGDRVGAGERRDLLRRRDARVGTRVHVVVHVTGAGRVVVAAVVVLRQLARQSGRRVVVRVLGRQRVHERSGRLVVGSGGGCGGRRVHALVDRLAADQRRLQLRIRQLERVEKFRIRNLAIRISVDVVQQTAHRRKRKHMRRQRIQKVSASGRHGSNALITASASHVAGRD